MVRATSTSESLRTTVPSGVVRDLDLGLGDTLRWEIRANEDGILVVMVMKE